MTSRRLWAPLIAVVLISTALPAVAEAPAKASFIVKVVPGKSAEVRQAIVNAGGSITRTYSNVFEGFALDLPATAAQGLKNNPNVEVFEADGVVKASATQAPTPSWGIDRVDQRGTVGSSASSSYTYDSAGTGATIYIVDTGIYANDDIASRIATTGYTAIADGRGTVDCNGHGTHVAGTTAGTKYGIAKNARLVAVRVLDCNGSGSTSGVIAGMDWILSSSNPNPKTQAVVNMSLGGGLSSTMNSAVSRLTTGGVVVVVAAGNSSADACNSSPSSAPSAITVGATTSADSMASYSNYGSCVDINAPGSGITSSWIGSPTASNTISGTSMASPHVAGVAAVYVGLNPSASVAAVTTALNDNATTGAVTGLVGSTPNRLLYVPADTARGVTPPPPSTGALPTVSTPTFSGITRTSATALVTVDAAGSSTSLTLDVSTSSTFSTLVAATRTGLTGTTTQSFSLTNLTAQTTYYVRASATNSTGTTTSAVTSFRTPRK